MYGGFMTMTICALFLWYSRKEAQGSLAWVSPITRQYILYFIGGGQDHGLITHRSVRFWNRIDCHNVRWHAPLGFYFYQPFDHITSDLMSPLVPGWSAARASHHSPYEHVMTGGHIWSEPRACSLLGKFCQQVCTCIYAWQGPWGEMHALLIHVCTS